MILKQVSDQMKIFKDMGMNKWRETKMADLKRGTRIRIYSPNGRPLETGGDETFITLTDAFLNTRSVGRGSKGSFLTRTEALVTAFPMPGQCAPHLRNDSRPKK